MEVGRDHAADRKEHVMARNGIIVLILLFPFQPASASPEYYGFQILVQPDGTQFIVEELSDEFGHYLLSEKGGVIQNSRTGYYYYPRYDIIGNKTPTSLRYGRDDASSDKHRLRGANWALFEAMVWTFQGWDENEDGEPLSPHPWELCANGIVVPEPQDNHDLVFDCKLLLAVRDSLDGFGFLNWSPDTPISDWDGVAVSDDRVTELNLSGQLLTGSIPPQLAYLGELKVLDLGYNALTGTIPPELGELGQLENLALNGNALTGTIPPEFDQLTRLRTLDLEFNELTGTIPPELSQLSELKELLLGYNALTGTIPPELGQLSHLNSLSFDDNALTGMIPPEVGQLVHLENLSLSGNALTGTIPPELGQLPQLEDLSLNDNALMGAIPPELATLTKLVRLNLDTNQLTGAIPPELGQLSQLEDFWLGDNALTGTIPPELGQLTQLRALSLHNNELTGTIPPELGQLRELKGLFLGHNALTGTIPSELGQLIHIEGLYLQNNALTGPIPPELGQLIVLENLSLNDNALTGEIPPELATLTELKYLYLSFNQLTGSIPPELGQLTGILQVNLRNNQLTGPIPLELFQLTEIPPELAHLAELKELALEGNDLGCVPEALAEWADDLPLCPDAPSASDETATSVEVVSQNLPTTSGLSPNYPNPFNASTQIAYHLATPGPVRLKIYNTLGQPVRTLVDQFQTAGSYQVHWDARDQQGAPAATGVYFTRLHYPGGVQTQRLLLLK